MNAAPSTPGRLRREWLLCLAAVLACALLLMRSGVMERVDLAVYDAALRLDGAQAHPDILIVAVDEASLSALGRWPWPREHHAQLLRTLAATRPRAVALDLLFTEPAERPATDDALAGALAVLREAAPVFLPMTLGEPLARGRVPQPLLPLPAFEQAASGLGHIHVELDSDSVARSLYLHEGTAGRRWSALSLRLAQAAGAGTPPRGPDAPPDGTGWLRESRLLLPFVGGPGAYRTVPYVSVLRGEVPAAALRDKVVLVGLTATGVGDRYPTPLSGASALTPGVEINAAAVDGLLTGRMLRPVGAGMQMLAAVLALIAWMACLWRLGPRGGLWGLFAFVLLALGVSVGLQGLLRWWLPVASWWIAALLGYLLWSWRRLAALLADLYRRAETLRPGAAAEAAGPGGWQHVVDALDRGLAAEQQVQRQRNEALQLLSHDLRAPQSAILALLHGAGQAPSAQAGELHGRIEQQVRATLDLADDFVMQLRAEGDAYDWQEVDLAQLAIDVHDRAWPLAKAKDIALALQLPRGEDGSVVESCWMNVDPRMLGRALFNLVENAIKYSPPHTRVELALAWQPGEDAVFTVRDQGVGIVPADLPRLFERYGRVGDTGATIGHGLGLSLVKTVAERHGGHVQCASTPGEGSVFTLAVPGHRAMA